MQSGAISDDQVTASSEYNGNLAAKNGRLLIGSAWSAGKGSNNEHQWLQIDLGVEYTSNVTQVATQGSRDYDEWVTEYKLDYSDDGGSFQYYKKPGKSKEKVESTLSPLKRSLTDVFTITVLFKDKTERGEKTKQRASKNLTLVNHVT